ncbi:MAG: hypothetical protein RLZZ417_1580 [Bacteroidota bacterium]
MYLPIKFVKFRNHLFLTIKLFKMDAFIKSGKYLLAIPMAIFGLFHFISGPAMAGMVPAAIPGGVLWVYLTGIALVAAAAAILTDKMAKLASVLLAILLLVFVLVIHLKGAMAGDQAATASILKDIAIAGGALVFAGTRKS